MLKLLNLFYTENFILLICVFIYFFYLFIKIIDGIEVSRTPKGCPEQLAIVLTFQMITIPHFILNLINNKILGIEYKFIN